MSRGFKLKSKKNSKRSRNNSELSPPPRIEEIEKDFQRHVNEDLEAIRKELKVIASSTSKLEGEISDKWNILVKLRRNSYDKIMYEYKKVEKKILIEEKIAEEITREEQKEI